VVYASSSSALATGSAFNFNGTSLGIGSSSYGDAGSITASIGVAGTTAGGLQLWASSAQEHYIQWGDSTSGSATYAGAISYSHASDFMRFWTGSTEQMRLNGTGLGIGTSSPAQKLHVNVASGNIYEQISSGANNVYIGYDSGRGIGVLESNTSLAFDVGAGYAEGMRLTSTGLGIGTSSPNRLLSLYATQPVFQITNVACGNTQGTIQYQASGGTDFILDNQGSGSGGNIIFQQAGSERLKINAYGIGLGGATPSSGTGITFPATQSASSNANTLDDYEEGTFTPTLQYSGTNTPSYIVQTGRYTKIGRIVQIQILLGWNENGSTGNLLFTGLPFTSINSNGRAAVTFLSFGLLLVTSSITGFVNVNSTSIEPFINDNTGSAVTATNTDNDQDVYMTVTYEVA
jgi:hypothetical protein